MKKNEIQIISDTYKNVYSEYKQYKVNSYYDAYINIHSLMISLNLNRECYSVENAVISDINNYNSIVKEMFEMIFDNFIKYNKYVNYDIEEIEEYFENLQYDMTDEEIKVNKNRINYIRNNI